MKFFLAAELHMKRCFICLLGVCFFVISQANAVEWVKIQPLKIAPRTYVIEHGPHDEDPKVSRGFHNNPGFVVTNAGVVVIDTGSSYEIGKMILQKIRSITSKPVTYIFTTHFHGDHWLANQAIVEAYPDVLTIAHPQARTYSGWMCSPGGWVTISQVQKQLYPILLLKVEYTILGAYHSRF